MTAEQLTIHHPEAPYLSPKPLDLTEIGSRQIGSRKKVDIKQPSVCAQIHLLPDNGDDISRSYGERIVGESLQRERKLDLDNPHIQTAPQVSGPVKSDR